MSNPQTPIPAGASGLLTRRSFFANGSRLTLSATAVALLAGAESLALGRPAQAGATSDDLNILNGALGAEMEAIAAYQVGAESGLIGRRAGSLSGFDYSEAMRQSGLVWNRQTLDRFLKAPLDAVPGTLMGYDGVKDDGDRADLIAYLVKASARPNLCS